MLEKDKKDDNDSDNDKFKKKDKDKKAKIITYKLSLLITADSFKIHY